MRFGHFDGIGCAAHDLHGKAASEPLQLFHLRRGEVAGRLRCMRTARFSYRISIILADRTGKLLAHEAVLDGQQLPLGP